MKKLNSEILKNTEQFKLVKFEFDDPFLQSVIDNHNIRLILNVDTNEVFQCEDFDIQFCLGIKHVSNTRMTHSQKIEIIQEYLETYFDLTVLSDNSLKLFIEDISKLVRINLCDKVKYFDRFVSSILNDNKSYTKNELTKLFDIKSKWFHQLSLEECLGQKAGEIKIKYLLATYKVFSGGYSIRFYDTYETISRRSYVFDSIHISLPLVSSDYNSNHNYINSHAKEIKDLIFLLLKQNERGKKYVDFIKIKEVVLTKQNILIIKLCFKDGLKELLK